MRKKEGRKEGNAMLEKLADITLAVPSVLLSDAFRGF